MNPAQGEPSAARALLVAVETYEAGTAWNLDGPVRDALAHRSWLLGQGFAPEAITLLVSPLPENCVLLQKAGVEEQPADRESVHRALFRELAETASDWLFVAWSGHGLVDLDGHRRLVYADAVGRDLRSLDVEAALAAFRSDIAPAHPRQLWLLDACQTFTDAASAANALRPDPVPRGRLRAVREQQVLFACGPGEATGNRVPGAGARDGVPRASGAFSSAALALLRAHPEWRHDAAQLAAALREEFSAAAAGGEAAVMPTSLWFEGAGHTTRAEVSRAAPRRRLGPADHRRMYDALADLPVMQDPGLRAAVIGHLPLEICASVPRSPVMRIEILALIRTCLVFENGLLHLWDAVSLLDAGTLALSELETVLRDYPEWFTPL
ncbi:effector-associated domain 2-containing protein [Streptomyces sp. CA-288835]|uniref:effector-associated domain 2-containing protein n=1 Tax=Streptomyces sp. CA-288835 TaxID=3240069 RepID=UPI003D93D929